MRLAEPKAQIPNFFGAGFAELFNIWADPGRTVEKARRAMRAMRGKTLETVPFSTVLWVHKKLPQSTIKLVLPSNESYESKTGCNRTLATILWVPLNIVSVSEKRTGNIVKRRLQ